MFTGIVEEIGKVRSIKHGSDSAKLTIEARKVLEGVKIGDSIAVNGVCLTVTSCERPVFTADVMFETLRSTDLGQLKRGDLVNLERALGVNGRFGGHIVTGHIDGTGAIVGKKTLDIATVFTVRASEEILRYIVKKGSIAIDGISLTVVDVTKNSFEVSIIPHTAKETTLKTKSIGDIVNLETDLLAKYVEKFFQQKLGENDNKQEITADFLAGHGFI